MEGNREIVTTAPKTITVRNCRPGEYMVDEGSACRSDDDDDYDDNDDDDDDDDYYDDDDDDDDDALRQDNSVEITSATTATISRH